MKKKAVPIFFLLVFVSALFIWREPLTKSAAHLGVKYYCNHVLKQKISYDELYVHGLNLSFENLVLGSEKKTLAYGGGFFSAKEITLRLKPSLSKRRVGLNILAHSPKITLVKTKDYIPNLSFVFSADSNSFYFLENLSLRDGRVVCLDRKNHDQKPLEFSFSSQLDSKADDFAFWETRIFQDKSSILWVQEFLKEEIHSKLSIKNVELDQLKKQVEFFQDQANSRLKGNVTGSFSGDVCVEQKKHSPINASGEFLIQNLFLEISDGQTKVLAPKINFEFKEALVSEALLKKFSFDTFIEDLSASQSLLNLDSGLEISYGKSGKNVFSALQSSGNLQLQKGELSFKFNASVPQIDPNCQMTLQAKGSLPLRRGDLEILFAENSAKPTKARFSIDPYELGQHKIFGEVKELKPRHLNVLLPMVSPLFNNLESMVCQEGVLNASFQALFDEMKISSISVDDLIMKKGSFVSLKSDYPHVKNLNLTGSLTLGFESQNPLNSLGASFEFKADSLKYQDYDLTNVEGMGELLQQKLARFFLNADVSGLQAKVRYDDKLKNNALDINLEGFCSQFLKFCPDVVQEAYSPLFQGARCEVEMKGNVVSPTCQIMGKALIDTKHFVKFGCNLEKNNALKSQENHFKEVWDHFFKPLKIAPSLAVFENVSQKKSSSFCDVKEGWFECQKVPIEKFIRPLIFDGSNTVFEGVSDLKGKFDSKGLSVSYDHYHIVFDHEYVSLEFNSTETLSKPGYHYFNFDTNQHFGSVFVEKAKCEVKSAQLNFLELSGQLHINPDRIYSDNLSAFVSNMTFSSSLDLNFLPQGELNLDLSLSELKGKMSEFKSLFEIFEVPFLNNLPLEGNLSMEPSKTFFKLVKKEEVDWQIKISGKMDSGKLKILGMPKIEDVCTKFSYDTSNHILKIEEFTSVCQASAQQKYQFYSDYFEMHLLDTQPAKFDLKVKNEYQDCARLCGKLYFNFLEPAATLKFILDQNHNHVGNIEFSNVHLSFDESLALDYLNVNFSSDLITLERDLSLLQSLVPKISTNSFNILKSAKLTGEILGHWVFKKGDAAHVFSLWGDAVQLNDFKPAPFQLKLKKQGAKVFIEDVKYQGLNAQGTFEEKTFCYLIKDFKIQSQENLNLLMSGLYCKMFHSFEANVTAFHCNFSEIKKMELFSKLPLLQETSGILDLTGKIEGGFFKGGFNYSLNIEGNSHNFQTNDVLLKDDKIRALIEGNLKKIALKKFECSSASAFGYPLNLDLRVKNLNWSKTYNERMVEKIDFVLPANHLASLKHILEKRFKVSLPAQIETLKKDRPLKGSFSFDPKKRDFAYSFKFQEGRYHFLNKRHFLNELSLNLGVRGVQVDLKGPIWNKPYWLRYLKKNGSSNEFEVQVFDKNPEKTNQCLSVLCLENKKNIEIEKINGHFLGLYFDFIHKPDKDTPFAKVLMGQMRLLEGELFKRFPWEISEKLKKLQIGKGYFLTGQLKLPTANVRNFFFEGLLGGQDFELLGFEFKSLSSEIKCSLEHIHINNLKVSDLSGELSAQHIDLALKPLGYQIHIPSIRAKDFKPSLLRLSSKQNIKHKPLILERIELRDIGGNLSDLNTLTGHGFFTFEKTPKKQASLLDIPAHLISKIGLDHTMLNPTEGKVLFEIDNQRVLFTKLHDVYSHDKRCHFTLSKYPDLSYMDFDGTLNIKIKMKQYVLLKITEPFIISVQGHYLAPRYSFTRKKMVVDVPQAYNQAPLVQP